MTAESYACSTLNLPHDEFLRLVERDAIILGVEQSVLAQIADMDLGRVRARHSQFWKCTGMVGVALGITAICLAVVHSLWWLIGLISFELYFQAQRRLSAFCPFEFALENPDFYEKVRLAQGWIYRMHPLDAVPYLVSATELPSGTTNSCRHIEQPSESC